VCDRQRLAGFENALIFAFVSRGCLSYSKPSMASISDSPLLSRRYCQDEEFDAIAIESNHPIEIDSFVPRSEIDERYLDSPYYIAPNEPVGQEAFAVIHGGGILVRPV
jgi:hypothetical protein